MAADDDLARPEDVGKTTTGNPRSATDGGLAAAHLVLARRPALVAPTTDDRFNQIVAGLDTVACWRVDDVRFLFDSSFPGPELEEELTALAVLRQRFAKTGADRSLHHPPLSVFGHADPTGDDDYNKALSGRRALAIYGLLVRDTALWEKLYGTRIRGQGDPWGNPVIDTMLATLGFVTQPGHRDEGVRQFQQQAALEVDGKPGPQTRNALFLAYMNRLAGTLRLSRTDDFLAGTDPDHRGDVQGCSEFNPIRIFSKAQVKRFAKAGEKTARDDENAPNRRVMVLLFRPGSRIRVADWPCPKAAENAAACRSRFWSDVERRRAHTDETREFGSREDTFSCRFYQRLANGSPCESIVPLVTLKLRLIDDADKPYDSLSYRLEAGGFTMRGTLAADGVIERRIPAGTTSGLLTLLQPGVDNDADAFWRLPLAITDGLKPAGDVAGAQARLANLGLLVPAQLTGREDEPTRRAIQRFQTREKVPDAQGKIDISGDLTGPTVDRLEDRHDR